MYLKDGGPSTMRSAADESAYIGAIPYYTIVLDFWFFALFLT